MKKIVLLILFLTGTQLAKSQFLEETDSIVPFYQQMDSVFANVDLNRMETKYLLEKSLVDENQANFSTNGIRAYLTNY